MYLTCSAGNPPAREMAQAITVFAVMDAFIQGVVLAGSELGKRLTTSEEEVKAFPAPTIKNYLLVGMTTGVTAVTAFNGVQDCMEDFGASTPLSLGVGVVVALFAGYSSYRFTLDRTVQAEKLAFWPKNNSRRAQFIGSAVLGNSSQALMTFYQLYRISQKIQMNLLTACLVDAPITVLSLWNFNQTQIRLMGNRLVKQEHGALPSPREQKRDKLSCASKGALFFLKGASFLNVISAPAMLLTLFAHLFFKD